MKTLHKLLIIGFTAFTLAAIWQIGTADAVSCQRDSDCGQDWWKTQFCKGNDIYGDYVQAVCNKPAGTTVGSCTYLTTEKHVTSCVVGSCRNINQRASCDEIATSSGGGGEGGTYVAHSYTQCSGTNTIYWFDSNNNRNDLYQTCATGYSCSGNTCVNSYTQPPYTPPTTPPYNPYVLRGCVGNISYWYDSTGKQNGVYQNCTTTGQTCNEGVCIGTTKPTVVTTTQIIKQEVYVKHYETKCADNNLFWHDSKGDIQNIFMSCADDNQCTFDTCSDGQCKHELVCDGSLCAVNSDDYIKYCAGETSNNGSAAVSESGFSKIVGQWLIWIILAAILIVLFVVIFRRISKVR